MITRKTIFFFIIFFSLFNVLNAEAAETRNQASLPVASLLKSDGTPKNKLISGDENWDDRFSVPGQGVNDVVTAMAAFDGAVYVGGLFLQAGGDQVNHIAKWNGRFWSALGSGLNGSVLAVSAGSGMVYAAGTFSQAGSVPVNNIAKWDGGSWIQLGRGINGEVSALAVELNTLYAGGLFTSAGGVPVNNIAKWDGSAWTGLGDGLNGKVHAIVIDGKDVYVGGEFTIAGGIQTNYIAKWNGNSWSPLGRGLDGFVRALSTASGDLYVGGDFINALYGTDNAVWANHVVKWDGVKWNSMGNRSNPGVNSSVFSISASSTCIFIGGLFTDPDLNNAPHVKKWDGNDWVPLGRGTNDRVAATAISGSDVYVGGPFNSAGGMGSSFFGCWHEPPFAPEFSLEPLEAYAGYPFSFRPKIKGWPAPDVSLVTGPEGMTYDAQTGTVRWTPNANQTGRQQFTLKAANSVGTVQQVFMIWVNSHLVLVGQHNTNRVQFTALNDGSVGKRGAYVPNQVGFKMDGAGELYEGQLVIGKSPSQVSGGLYLYEFGIQSAVVPIASGLSGFDQAYQTRFTDAKMPDPIGIEVVQRSHSKSTDPDRDYVIMEYWIKNATAQTLAGIYVGLAMDWDVGYYIGQGGKNRGGYDETHRLNYMVGYLETAAPKYFGVAALTGDVSGSAVWKNGSDDNSDGVLYDRMTHFSNEDESVPYDRRSMLSVGPYTIPVGDSVRCIFAVLGGNSLDDLKANADTAAAKLASEGGWSVSLSAAFGNAPALVRSFGGHPDATDGYDPALDVLSPPPPPGYPAFFEIDPFPYNLLKDMRRWVPPYDEAIDWTFGVDAQNASFALSWNPSDLPPQGNFTLVRGSERTNMRGSTQYSFSGNTSRIVIQYRPLIESPCHYKIDREGWYLISLPVVPQDSTVGKLFPSQNNHLAYSWDPATRSYITNEKMEPGRAYWMYFMGPMTCTVTGARLRRYTSRYEAQGWFLAGSPLGGADFSNPESDPEGQVLSPVFGWDPNALAYFSTAAMEENQGYWIAVIGPCVLTVNGRYAQMGKGMKSEDWDTFCRKFGRTPPGPPDADVARWKPQEYILFQNYPNPFNAETRIMYALPEEAEVDLTVYDTQGRVVQMWKEGRQAYGGHTVIWNGSGRPSGMYVIELKAGSFRQIKKCVLLK